MNRIIVLNPRSTSTKVAVYDGEEKVFQTNISHPASELAKYEQIVDQLPYRKQVIEEILAEQGVDISSADAFSAICTGLLTMPGGVFEVNDVMYEHGKIGPGSKHPGNLGPLLAKDFADKYGRRAFVVDPSSLDEFCEEARMTGFVEILRTPRGHPLNQRAVARRYAAEHGSAYEDMNLVVVHLGGGISIGAHEHGKMVDNVDSSRGEGRMAPTRSGTAPLADVVEMCFSGDYTKADMINKVMRTGGWTAHLDTSDAIEVEKRIEAGDAYAEVIYRTTAYPIAKDVAAMAAAMKGEVDAIILTGGIAYSKLMTKMIAERTEWIAPVEVYPGEYEMDALAAGAIRALDGVEEPKSYTGEPVFPGFDKLYDIKR